MPFSPGLRLLDRYVLEDEIGHGGMSRVFRARDERSGKVVAVKQMVIDDEESVDTFRAWFKREIKALMVLDHPGVPRLLDYSGDGDPFVVIEFLNGFDLDVAIATHGAMPEAAAVLVSVKLLHALANAHQNAIIHRDIKPANMFLCFNGRVVLLDFGLARANTQQQGRTLAGALNTKLIGTPQYFSPEQISGGVTLSAASDLYSLGASLYFMLSGKHAFVGDGPLAVIKAIGTNQRRSLAQAAHWLRPETVAFVEQLMAFEADARPKSAHDAMAAAEGLLRFFPDAEALLRRYVSALEQKEKPPAPQVGATMDVASVDLLSPAAPTPTPITQREENTVVSSSQTMIVTTPSVPTESTNVITSPASAKIAPKKSRRTIALAVFVFVSVVGVALVLLTKKPAKPTAVAVTVDPVLPEPTTPSDALPPPTAAEAVPTVPKIVAPPENEEPRPRRVETGTLNLQLKQWAEVIVDGKSFGRKQIMASLTLPEGAHEIELRNDRYGARQKRITIKRGQEVSLQVDFAKQLP